MADNRIPLSEVGNALRGLFTDNRIALTKARDNLGGVVSQVAYGKSHVMLTKGTDYMAVMVPPDWYVEACAAMGHDPATTLVDPRHGRGAEQ